MVSIDPSGKEFLLFSSLFFILLFLIWLANPTPRKLKKIENWLTTLPNENNIDMLPPSTSPTTAGLTTTPNTCAECGNQSNFLSPCVNCRKMVCLSCLKKGKGLCPSDYQGMSVSNQNAWITLNNPSQKNGLYKLIFLLMMYCIFGMMIGFGFKYELNVLIVLGFLGFFVLLALFIPKQLNIIKNLNDTQKKFLNSIGMNPKGDNPIYDLHKPINAKSPEINLNSEFLKSNTMFFNPQHPFHLNYRRITQLHLCLQSIFFGSLFILVNVYEIINYFNSSMINDLNRFLFFGLLIEFLLINIINKFQKILYRDIFFTENRKCFYCDQGVTQNPQKLQDPFVYFGIPVCDTHKKDMKLVENVDVLKKRCLLPWWDTIFMLGGFGLIWAYLLLWVLKLLLGPSIWGLLLMTILSISYIGWKIRAVGKVMNQISGINKH